MKRNVPQPTLFMNEKSIVAIILSQFFSFHSIFRSSKITKLFMEFIFSVYQNYIFKLTNNSTNQ